MSVIDMLTADDGPELAALGLADEPSPAPKLKVTVPDIDPSTLPCPLTHRLMVLPVVIPEETEFGLVLTADTVRNRELLRTVGKVVGMGPTAYTGHFFADLEHMPIQIGDYICYHSYHGIEIKVKDRNGMPCSLKFINDDEVLALVKDPQALMVMV